MAPRRKAIWRAGFRHGPLAWSRMEGSLKAVYVARFRADMTRAQAGDYWTHVHAPMADGLRDMVRYVQSHVTGPVGGREEPPGGLAFDGYACEWWRDRARFEAGMQTPDWATIVADGVEFLDTSSLAGMSVIVDENVVAAGAPAPYKLAFFMRFRDDVGREAALAHWRGPHAAIALELPGLVRYVQNAVAGSLGAGGTITDARAAFDGFAELWFEDEAAWLAAAGTEAAERLYRDTFEFADMESAASMSASVVERVIKPKG